MYTHTLNWFIALPAPLKFSVKHAQHLEETSSDYVVMQITSSLICIGLLTVRTAYACLHHCEKLGWRLVYLLLIHSVSGVLFHVATL